MVEALLAAGIARVSWLADPLTQELMAIAGPEHFITGLIHNHQVKIILLEEEEEEEGSQLTERSCLNMR